MRILFCDPLNTQNSFYIYAKFLRQYGVDAHVVIDSSPSVPKEHLPVWHDAMSASEDSKWVHYFKLPYFLPFVNPAKYLIRQQRLLNFANTFDIIACSGLAPIWMRWSKRPFIFFSYGSDLDQMAIQGWSGKTGRKFDIIDRLMHLWIKYHLVGSLHKAIATVLAPYQIPTAEKVGLTNLKFMPHVIDISLFKPMDGGQRTRTTTELHRKYDADFLILHPPRHAWTDRTVADCKGNDKVIRALAKFVKCSPKAKLITMNKGWDMQESKSLADRLGVADNIIWLDMVDKTEMVRLYNAVDVVLDQFVVGVLALVAIEAMACGTPAITFVKDAPSGMFYPEMPPVMLAHDDEDILRNLISINNDGELKNTLGMAGRSWVERHCSPEITIQEYTELFEQAISRKKKGDYVSNFGFEWTKHDRTQVADVEDAISMFKGKTGLTEKDIKGKTVLDAGCGAGRFAQVAAMWGAKKVVGVDLSDAVVVAAENLKKFSNVEILRGDINNLPIADESFDVVFSIGVLHHTPNTKQAFMALHRLLKKGGTMAIWVYPNEGIKYKAFNLVSSVHRLYTTRMDKGMLYALCRLAIPLYYLHRIPVLRYLTLALFPCSIHPKPMWRVLDTFDWYSPKYQWKHTYKEVEGWFRELEYENITRIGFPVAMTGTRHA